jgi:hypothetical protein
MADAELVADETAGLVAHAESRIADARQLANDLMAKIPITTGLPIFMRDKPLCVFVGGSLHQQIVNIPGDQMHRFEVIDGDKVEAYVPAIVIQSSAAGILAGMMVSEGLVASSLRLLRAMNFNVVHDMMMRICVLTFGAHDVSQIAAILKEIRAKPPVDSEASLFLKVR